MAMVILLSAIMIINLVIPTCKAVMIIQTLYLNSILDSFIALIHTFFKCYKILVFPSKM